MMYEVRYGISFIIEDATDEEDAIEQAEEYLKQAYLGDFEVDSVEEISEG